MSDAPPSSPEAAPRFAAARLRSLDALRGFDMFWIVGAEDLVHGLRELSESGVAKFLASQMSHKDWAGFAAYDLIFPLFVFMVGVSLVFSLSRIVEEQGRAAATGRVLRRSLLLYLLGIFYYGGFATPLAEIRLLGVLQRIALCYLGAGLLYCHVPRRARDGAFVGLLLAYWALMTFVPVPGFGAGDFSEGRNLANWIDSRWLPLRKWDGDHDPEGLLSTLPAIASCLLGVRVGEALRRRDRGEQQKVLRLALAGVVLLGLGWAWHLQFPVVKKLWTSSFVLVAGGYSCLLLALFHQTTEVWQCRRWAEPFVWIGMNPIAIYLAHNLVDLGKIARRFVGGDVNQWFGRGGEMMVALAVVVLTFGICRFLYRRGIFLRL